MLSLGSMFAIVFSIMVVILITQFSILYITQYSKSAVNTLSLASNQTIEQLSHTINNYITDIETSVTLISKEISNEPNIDKYNSILSRLTSTRQDVYISNIYDENFNELSFTVRKNYSRDLSVSNISLDRNNLKKLNRNEINFSKPHVNSVFKNVYPWVFTMSYRIYSTALKADIYVVSDVSFSTLAQNIDYITIGKQGYAYIQDIDGNIVYHPRQELINASVIQNNSNLIKQAKTGVSRVKDNAFIKKPLNSNPAWMLIGVSYLNDIIKSEISNLLILIFTTVIVALATLLIIAIILNKFISVPVKNLTQEIKKFESDYKYDINHLEVSVNEIRMLYSSFSHLSLVINELIEKVKQEQAELQKTELKALQSQINPHFLYNTLDSIVWMYENDEKEKGAEMIIALSKLFRISISKGREFITIKEEIAHAESYLKIQQIRYDKQFKYEIISSADLENYYCNKITIQPFIENSLIHALIPGESMNIKIEISASSDTLFINIKDNGCGINEEMLKKLNSKENYESQGIGVKNINDRILINFGKQYGVSITSEEDIGTNVLIKIPILTEEMINEKNKI